MEVKSLIGVEGHGPTNPKGGVCDFITYPNSDTLELSLLSCRFSATVKQDE